MIFKLYFPVSVSLSSKTVVSISRAPWDRNARRMIWSASSRTIISSTRYSLAPLVTFGFRSMSPERSLVANYRVVLEGWAGE